MAYIIKICLDCKKEYGRTKTDKWARDVKSHGYCEACAKKEGLK